MQTKPQETYPGRNRWGQEKGNGSDLGERVEGELGDGEELVLGDEALGAAVELAEPLVQGHDLLLRDCSRTHQPSSAPFHQKRKIPAITEPNSATVEERASNPEMQKAAHRGSCSAPGPPRCRTGSASTTRYPWLPLPSPDLLLSRWNWNPRKSAADGSVI